MSIDQFFAELKSVRDQFDWMLIPVTRDISREQRSKARLHLRAEPKEAAVRAELDPVGAVCYARTGKVFDPRDWPEAGETLSMAPSDSANIHAASNDRTWTGPKGTREPLPTMITLRERLVECVGIAVQSV